MTVVYFCDRCGKRLSDRYRRLVKIENPDVDHGTVLAHLDMCWGCVEDWDKQAKALVTSVGPE